MKRISTMVMLAVASLPAIARVIPGPCGTDPNVQCAVYDKNEVYEVATAPGKAVLLMLEDGEAVAENGAGMGDGKAWIASKGKNWVQFKPKTIKPDTNFLVVTNKRTYVFSLETAKRGEPQTWMLRFDYPDTRAKNAAELARKREMARGLAASASAQSVHRNDQYMKRGDDVLSPTAMWDDGTLTYLQYATGRDLPRVFAILPDGSEALANVHMDGDTLVVHSVAREWVLRLGNAVMGIRNDGFAPDGNYNASGTTLPGMVRITKEQSK
ncbi:TrbG/VirB9 family P-type conjugative transfer protein [Burkholderia sp. KJ006]|uniref:TrbG/VirB9 family P-type conjugative transfer protein n=1 Tax=Burkholderia sp. KJ006 TaxID=416344 RepID=UPI0005A2DDF8|nr:TrbG/VirB9 family P-type conjugative transfer protein [Burkholderia sp. KJ006]